MLSFVFVFKKKKLSSFTKPCNVLRMFLNFDPLKPYVLIWFVLITKKSVVNYEYRKIDLFHDKDTIALLNSGNPIMHFGFNLNLPLRR